MKNREITVVAIKIFALYVLVQAIWSIPSYVQLLMFNSNPSQNSINMWPWIIGCSSILIIFGFGLALWKLSNSIYTKLSNHSHEEHIIKIDEGFILSVVGIFFTIDGLIQVSYACSRAYAELNTPYAIPQEVSIHSIVSILVFSIQTIIGLTLIFRSTGWANLLRKIREVGLTDKSSK